jgi:hypothetical protein
VQVPVGGIPKLIVNILQADASFLLSEEFLEAYDIRILIPDISNDAVQGLLVPVPVIQVKGPYIERNDFKMFFLLPGMPVGC